MSSRRTFGANLKDKLNQKMSKKSSSRDERFWRLTDSKKNNNVIIRPVMDKKEECFITLNYHNFKYINSEGETQNFYRVCPDSFGSKSCPICKKRWSLWVDHGGKDIPEKAPIRDELKKLSTSTINLTNIYVDNDDQNSENNGKVFLYKMNTTISNIIKAQLNPPENIKNSKKFVDFNPYDPYSAKNIELIYTNADKTKNKYPSWEGSGFFGDLGSIIYIKEKTQEENDKLTNDILDKAYDIVQYVQDMKDNCDTDESEYWTSDKINDEMRAWLTRFPENQKNNNKSKVNEEETQDKNHKSKAYSSNNNNNQTKKYQRQEEESNETNNEDDPNIVDEDDSIELSEEDFKEFE